eukprot:4542005-Heterocapsa_arctica.AAC.1
MIEARANINTSDQKARENNNRTKGEHILHTVENEERERIGEKIKEDRGEDNDQHINSER